MSTSTARAPGSAGHPTTYQVLEHELRVSHVDASQVAVVGRGDAGIHLLLSEDAAEALAGLLVRYDAVDRDQLENFDPELWLHVAVDLLANKAMTLHADQAPVIARGYAPRWSERRRAVLRAVDQDGCGS